VQPEKFNKCAKGCEIKKIYIYNNFGVDRPSPDSLKLQGIPN
jgi:hypothetical protein